jgi:hypothetical protein
MEVLRTPTNIIIYAILFGIILVAIGIIIGKVILNLLK